MIKHTKQLSAILLSIMLLAMSSVTFFADSNSYYALTDDAGIFSTSEAETLSEQMESIGQTYGIQVIVHTSNDNIPSYDMESYYNQQYYDRQSFENDSVMLVIDYSSDNRIILTHGSAVSYFSDERMSEIKSNMSPYLKVGDLYGATEQFISTTESFFSQGIDSDGSFDNHTENAQADLKKNNRFLYVLSNYGIIIGVVAVIIGGIVTLIVYYRYKKNGMSGTYDLQTNSVVNLTECEDIFINEHVTSRVIQSSSSGGGGSHGGGGGGSSHGSSGSF